MGSSQSTECESGAIISPEDLTELASEFAEHNVEHGRMTFDRFTLASAIDAVIEKLGASEIKPILYAHRDVLGRTEGREVAHHAPRYGSDDLPLYDATALAAAHQQGRNEGREAARAELEAVAYRVLVKKNGDWVLDDRGWRIGPPADFLLEASGDRPDEVRIEYAYAARQPAQKEA